jgi:hypothetical protein
VLQKNGKDAYIEDRTFRDKGLIWLDEDTRGLVEWVGKALYGWKFRSTDVNWPDNMKKYQFIEYVSKHMRFELPSAPKKTQKGSRLSKQDKMIINALPMRMESIIKPVDIKAVEHLLKLRAREIPKSLDNYLRIYWYYPMERMEIEYRGKTFVPDGDGYEFLIQWFIPHGKYYRDDVESATEEDLERITYRSPFESIFSPRWGHHFDVTSLRFVMGMGKEPNLVIKTYVTFKVKKPFNGKTEEQALEYLKDKDINYWNNYIVPNIFGARTPVMKKPKFFIW